MENNKEIKKRLTVDINFEKHKKLKYIAALENSSLVELIDKATNMLIANFERRNKK